MHPLQSSRLASRKTLIWMLGLTALAFAFRLFALDLESLWNDELFTAGLAAMDTPGKVIEGCRADNHPPFYFLIVWLWVRLFGDSESALRMPSVIFGTLCVPATFALGRRLFDERVGILAAIFTAFLYVPWNLSQEARQYPLVELLSTGVGYFAYGIFRGTPSRNDWFGFLSFAVLLSYTHYYGLLVSAMFVIAMLIVTAIKRRNFGSAWFVTGAFALAYAPWAPALFRVANLEGHWIQRPTWRDIDQFIGMLYSPMSVLEALLALLFVIAAVQYMKRFGGEKPWPESYLALWIFIPLIVILTKSFVSTPIFYSKYMMVVVPAGHVVLGRVCALIAPRWTWQCVLAIGVAGIALAGDLWASGTFRRPTQHQFREAIAFVLQENARIKAPLLAFEWDARNFGYYVRRAKSEMEVKRLTKNQAVMSSADAVSSGAPRFWLLDGDFVVPDKLYQAIEKKYRIAKRAEFLGITVSLYEAN